MAAVQDFNYKVALASGLRELQAGRLRQAEQQFGYLCAKFPNAPGGYRGLAKVRMEQADRPGALTTLRDGAAKLAKAGEHGGVVALLSEALQLDPLDLAAHRRLAAALALAGEMETAVEEYRRYARALAPVDPAAAQRDVRYGLDSLGPLPALLELANELGSHLERRMGQVLASALTDGTSYGYVVHAVSAGVESADSATVQVTPAARACASANPVVLENCYPGNSGFLPHAAAQLPTGVEGFATASSIQHGESVDLKINSAPTTTVNIEIYRTGWYGGALGRLVSLVPGLSGTAQPACQRDGNTGLIDCSNWSTSFTLTTTASWPSGVYLLRLVRDDNGDDNHVLLIVRQADLPDIATASFIFTISSHAAFTLSAAFSARGTRAEVNLVDALFLGVTTGALTALIVWALAQGIARVLRLPTTDRLHAAD